MKLKKFINTVDPVSIDKIDIWGLDSEDPIWAGDFSNIPYWAMELKIGREDKNDPEPPIYFVPFVNEYNANLIKMVVNVIE